MDQLYFKRTQYVNSTPLPPPHLDDSTNYSKMLLKHNGDIRKVRWDIRGAVMMGTVGESWRGTSSGGEMDRRWRGCQCIRWKPDILPVFGVMSILTCLQKGQGSTLKENKMKYICLLFKVAKIFSHWNWDVSYNWWCILF